MKSIRAVLLCVAAICIAVHSVAADDALTTAAATTFNRPGHGHGDPILTDFEGVTFEFVGKADGYFSLYSDASHQVNTGLFKGFVDNHDGTYMDKFGVAFDKLRVLISLADQQGDIIVQSWSEERTAESTMLASGKAKSKTIKSSGNGALSISTEPWRPFTGRTVTLSTGILELSVWSTPAGVVDSFNVSQPAYLNFNMTMLAPPASGKVEGIIGESLQRMEANPSASQKAASEPFEVATRSPSPIKADEDDYAVSDIFGTDFAFNQFSEAPQFAAHRRALKETPFGVLQFPLKAFSHV